MLIDKMQASDGSSLLEKLSPDYADRLRLNVPAELRKLLGDVVTLLLKRINVPDDEIAVLTDQINERRFNEMFAGWNNYDVQEARRIAREEGRAEGHAEGHAEGENQGISKEKVNTAKRMFSLGMSVEMAAAVTCLSIEEVSKLRSTLSVVSEDAPEYHLS